MDKYKEEIETIKERINTYSKDEIFNADELALFYRQIPKKRLTTRRSIKNCDFRKDRITILLCCNYSGSFKFQPIVIHSSLKPKGTSDTFFREQQLKYYQQSSSWIDTSIWNQVLHDWDELLDTYSFGESEYTDSVNKVLFNSNNKQNTFSLNNIQPFQFSPKLYINSVQNRNQEMCCEGNENGNNNCFLSYFNQRMKGKTGYTFLKKCSMNLIISLWIIKVRKKEEKQ